MSLRGQLTAVVVLAATAAVLATSTVAFLLFDQRMRQRVDDSLRARADQVLGQQDPRRPVEFVRTEPDSVEGLGFFQDLVTRDGSQEATDAALPQIAAAVAAGEPHDAFFDHAINGLELRFYARNVQPDLALVLGRRVDDIDSAIGSLRVLALMIGFAGIMLAAGLGWLLASSALRPMSQLTEAVELAAATRDLAHRVPVTWLHEPGRLGRSVNALLEALDIAQRARQQLIADASHELRSPLASLRTNVEVLARTDELPARDRADLLRDIVVQTGELTTLVEDLVTLARERPPEALVEAVRFDEVVEDAVERVATRARTKQVCFVTDLSPCTVTGVAADLERAVANILDNAVKWSPPGSDVDVVLTAGGELAVRDRGAGIPADDLPHVFDRFYRAREARSLPGSGLGLAIVRKVADEHGGSVKAEVGERGGTTVLLRLPASGGDRRTAQRRA